MNQFVNWLKFMYYFCSVQIINTMSKVKFYLKNEKSPERLVIARFSFGFFEIDRDGKKVYKPLTLSTNEKINVKHWSPKTQRAKSTFIGHPEFNQRLNDIEGILHNIVRRFINDGRSDELNPETVKNEFNHILFDTNKKIKPRTQKMYLVPFIEGFINECKNGQRTIKKNGKQYSMGTIDSYKLVLKDLLHFETTKKVKLRFNDINLTFYNEFKKSLNDRGMQINTIGTRIKHLKVFIKTAYNEGLTNNDIFRHPDFVKITEEVQKIYLSESEISKIYELDLSNHPPLVKVRDMFIISCYTALRYSDIVKLNKTNFIKDGNFIDIKTQKGGQNVQIPTHWRVKEIFNKYDGNFPRVVQNNLFNRYLKDIGQMANINERINVSKTKGGLRIDTTKPKHELITAHTGRRSAATNFYLIGLDTLSIMKITGHRTESSFMKYIKVSNEESAKRLSSHPYFQKNG